MTQPTGACCIIYDDSQSFRLFLSLKSQHTMLYGARHAKKQNLKLISLYYRNIAGREFVIVFETIYIIFNQSFFT